MVKYCSVNFFIIFILKLWKLEGGAKILVNILLSHVAIFDTKIETKIFLESAKRALSFDTLLEAFGGKLSFWCPLNLAPL